jgi:DNA-binding transcriptional ArsR family regulator
MMDDKLFEQIKALGDENRFKIVTNLLSHDYCVGALAHRLGISKAAVSQHIKILREAGIVKGEKRGYWTHYRVDHRQLIQISETLQMIASRKREERRCTKELEKS